MHIYCKNCKKTHRKNAFPKKHAFPKKLVPISKNIMKEKSRCAICLTERTFIHEIEDKYGLKSKVKAYTKFFTDRCYKKNGDLLCKV